MFELVACLEILFGTWNSKFCFDICGLVYSFLACNVQCFVGLYLSFFLSIFPAKPPKFSVLCFKECGAFLGSLMRIILMSSGNFHSGICVCVCVLACVCLSVASDKL